MPDRMLLADLVLIAHFAVVLFIVGGLAMIWLGLAKEWRYARHRGFRRIHLGAIWFVAIETLLGYACPLTYLEDWLRADTSTESGFLQRRLSAILYWDLPWWVFAVAYLLFALLVADTYRRYPPR